MKKRFLTHEELFSREQPPYSWGERRLANMGMHIPYPLQYLVTMDPRTRDPRVTIATLGPLSWRPYTMSVNVPLTDAPTIHNLQGEGECVMALPTREQARQAWIASHVFPAGINAAEVARLTLTPSHRVQAPSIVECPLNFECIIEYYVEYHGYGIASLRVLGASLDDAVLGLSRKELTQLYPLNYVGEKVHADGTVSPRLAMMGDIAPCPTFPVGHKQGWDTRIRSWAADLAQEEFISGAERDLVVGWLETYQTLRLDPHLRKRKDLQHKLSCFSELAAWGEWDDLHAFLGLEHMERQP